MSGLIGTGSPAPAGIDPIDLCYEYEMDGTTVTRLTMRPPRVRDSRDAQRAGTTAADHEAALMANLCEVTPEFIAELHMADYLAMQRAYEDFLYPSG